jgi:DNA recombination protein RmuC
MDVIYFVSGIAIGSLASWFIITRLISASRKFTDEEFSSLQENAKQLELELQRYREKSEGLGNDLSGTKDALEKERQEVIRLNNSLSRRESEIKHLNERLQEQKEEVAQLQQKFAVEFKNLANEILEEKSKKFTDQNKVQLSEILNPLKEKIGEFEKKVEQTNKESIDRNASLKEQLKQLSELNKQITKDAENLTKALKGDSKTQGNWGEMQLEGILRHAGLEKDVHYFKEQNYKTEENLNQRLDYVIKLPDDKFLVLDSKVSLTAYANFFEETDDAKKEEYLKQHLASVKGHIKMLSGKNYQSLYEINQPDYVMMFVANEPALTTALREDANLYEDALDKNIVLVSTTTLLATLRTISYIWKQDLQNKNALEIARQAGALYDKFKNFTDDLIKVGNNLKSTQKSYEDAMNKLYDGKDNLIRKSERLKELGAKASKNMDQRLLDRATE